MVIYNPLKYQPVKLLLWLSCFLLYVSACGVFEGKVAINDKSTVVYQKDEVSQQEAKRLGDVLLGYGYFNTWDERTVYLDKEGSQYSVTFIVNAALFRSDQENIVAGFKVWQQWIQEYAFGYAPTLLVLADEQQQPLYTIQSTTRPATESNHSQ